MNESEITLFKGQFILLAQHLNTICIYYVLYSVLGLMDSRLFCESMPRFLFSLSLSIFFLIEYMGAFWFFIIVTTHLSWKLG